MIYKKEKFSEVENTVILEFGKGDILVTEGTGFDASYACVMFSNDEPREIGTETDEWKGKTSDDLKPDVIMTFTKPESIDVVIGMLQEAKKYLPQRNAVNL